MNAQYHHDDTLGEFKELETGEEDEDEPDGPRRARHARLQPLVFDTDEMFTFRGVRSVERSAGIIETHQRRIGEPMYDGMPTLIRADSTPIRCDLDTYFHEDIITGMKTKNQRSERRRQRRRKKENSKLPNTEKLHCAIEVNFEMLDDATIQLPQPNRHVNFQFSFSFSVSVGLVSFIEMLLYALAEYEDEDSAEVFSYLSLDHTRIEISDICENISKWGEKQFSELSIKGRTYVRIFERPVKFSIRFFTLSEEDYMIEFQKLNGDCMLFEDFVWPIIRRVANQIDLSLVNEDYGLSPLSTNHLPSTSRSKIFYDWKNFDLFGLINDLLDMGSNYNDRIYALALLVQFTSDPKNLERVDKSDMSDAIEFLRDLWQDEDGLNDELVRLMLIVVANLSKYEQFREELMDEELLVLCFLSLDFDYLDLSPRVLQLLRNLNKTYGEDLRRSLLNPECTRVLHSVKNRSCAKEMMRSIGMDVTHLAITA